MPTVLIVDDDESIRTLIAALLEREGLCHQEAADGVDAIVKLRRGRYDGLILDLMLPVLNGSDVIHYLSAEHRDMLPRTVIISAASERMLADFTTTVSAVLRKPFDIFELTAAVRACVDVSRTARADRAAAGRRPSTSRCDPR